MCDLKTCTKCGETKPLSGFSKEKTGKFGVRAYCKLCSNAAHKHWYANNREARAAYNKQRRVNNREARATYHKQWYADNREARATYHKQWYADNRETRAAYHKQWDAEHRDERNAWLRLYRLDPAVRWKDKVRDVLNKAVKRGDIIRPDTCSECGITGVMIHGHHPSYDPGNELDVIWVCARCHTAIHRDIEEYNDVAMAAFEEDADTPAVDAEVILFPGKTA